MSLNNGTTARRLALFTGASMAVATVASIGSALMPTAAAAQATCTSGTAITNNASNAVSIAGGNPNNPGVTCVYVGSGATVTAAAAMTVSTVANIPLNGINLSAVGGDSVNWTSTAGTMTGGAQTNGAVIDARTAAGSIDLNTASVTGTAATVTHGIYAESTGIGNVNIATTGTVSGSNATSGVAGIYAASNGGDIAVNFNSNSANTSGRLYGIRAIAQGGGDVTISGTRSAAFSNMATAGNAGIAAIDAATGTGLLTIDVLGAVSNSNTSGGIGIRTTTQGGYTVINLRAGSVIAGGTAATAVSTVIEANMTGGVTTINNTFDAGNTVGSTNQNRRDDGLLRAIGTGQLVFNSTVGGAVGVFQLGGFGGEFSFTTGRVVNGWLTTGQNTFSQGADTITNLAGAVIGVGRPAGGAYTLRTTTFAFGGGDDVFNNAGDLIVGLDATSANSFTGQTLVITGLEAFNNAGLIVMGSRSPTSDSAVFGAHTSDSFYDDVFVMQDGAFHGEEGSRIMVDALLNNVGQMNCSRRVDGLPQDVNLTDPDDARLVANDCLDFRGSAVSGRTGVIVNDVITGDRGAYNPEGNVLVDLAGSDPADVDPEAFYLSPQTAGYVATGGGFLDKGLFAYTVGYDPEDEAFKLYGVETPSSMQFTLLGGAANDLWRTATTPWLERRVSQRNAEDSEDLTPRFWMRGSLSNADREVADSVSAGAAVLGYDNSYTQKDASLAMGMDLGHGSAFGGEWVVGATAGYVQAKLTYDESVNTATFEGGSFGLYSGFTAGPFFHDLVINAALTNLLIDVPSLQLAPAGTLLETDVHALGAHMETGWRFALGPARIEPLATLSWSQARFDAIDVPADDPTRFGGEVNFDDANSMRAGLGLRFSMVDVAPSLIPIDVSLTGRSMRELDGESAVTIVNLGPDANPTRTLDGAYNEVNAGVSIGDVAEHFGAFLNLGGAWGDDYESQTGSVGMRLRW